MGEKDLYHGDGNSSVSELQSKMPMKDRRGNDKYVGTFNKGKDFNKTVHKGWSK